MKYETEIFSRQEIELAFKSMINLKIKNRKSSMMLDLMGYQISGANTSLLPVGVDGITTCHILKSPTETNYFIDEIYRLVNEFEKGTEIPRLIPKKYKVLEIETSSTKKRKIVIPCLRDQVVVRCILNRLNSIGITNESDKPNPKIVDITKKIVEAISDRPSKKIIRTDITNFYPSIDANLLLQKLSASHGDVIGEPIMHLIRKIILDNKSNDKYTGLPVGIGFCVLLANYFISQMDLRCYFLEVNIIRYEDDFLLVIDDETDHEMILKKFDAILKENGLVRSVEKTNITNTDEKFNFVGVNFQNRKPFIDQERFDKWKHKVRDDIKKQFRDLSLLKILNPSIQIPTNKNLVNLIWQEHKKGIRSKFYKHRLRINSIGKEHQV